MHRFIPSVDYVSHITKGEKSLMKKIICFLLSLVLLLCGGALAEGADGIDVSGVWYGDLFGVVCTLTFAEDGTYVIEGADVTAQQGVWRMDGGTLVLDEDTFLEMRLSVSSDMLILDFEGMMFRFTREMPVPFVPAEVNTEALIEQFAGQWSMTHLTSMGLIFDAGTLEMSFSLSISGTDAQAFLYMGSDEDAFTHLAEMSGVFEGGVLTLTEILPEPEPAPTIDPQSTADPYPTATPEPPVPMVWEVRLLQDGSMCLTDAMEIDYPVFIYLTPIMPLMMAE